jgi:hypothetical protein
MDTLLLDQALAEDFSMIIANPTPPLGQFAHELRQLWPIFEVQNLRRLGIDTYARGEDRWEIVVGHFPAASMLSVNSTAQQSEYPRSRSSLQSAKSLQKAKCLSSGKRNTSSSSSYKNSE